ncbi:MAG: GMC family oxidoreductase [Candidatus Krumholzibacteriia bacterium]
MQRHGKDQQAIVIGSGFGGTMAAWELMHAGVDTLMLERGPWVPRGPHNWDESGSLQLTSHYCRETPYVVDNGRRSRQIGACRCVGGPSVYYGAVSLRFRPQDFTADPHVVGDSGAEWPFAYDDIEPGYARAEWILDVAGDPDADPTEPPRSAPYPQKLASPSPNAERIAAAGRRTGLTPYRLPLAINHGGPPHACVACSTCDTFACAVEAKNDLATQVIPSLMRRGLDVRAETVAVKLHVKGGRVEAVEVRDRRTGETSLLHADVVVLSGGALASPHLLLASGLERYSPCPDLIGRYLTRHCSAIVHGVFPRLQSEGAPFNKAYGFSDLDFGVGDDPALQGKIGSIQQASTPPRGLIKAMLPRPIGKAVASVSHRLSGLLVMAEDQPRAHNRVVVDHAVTDAVGLPRLRIEHRHTARDLKARRALVGAAKRVLRRAGAVACYVHEIETFSHAMGTVRMGRDPQCAPLDPDGRFRGIDNLFVVDGSFAPTPSGVNPSLTIAANALRVGARIAAQARGERTLQT